MGYLNFLLIMQSIENQYEKCVDFFLWKLFVKVKKYIQVKKVIVQKGVVQMYCECVVNFWMMIFQKKNYFIFVCINVKKRRVLLINLIKIYKIKKIKRCLFKVNLNFIKIVRKLGII